MRNLVEHSGLALYLNIFFFLELETELRAFRLLGKRSTTEPNPQPQHFSFNLHNTFLLLRHSILLWYTLGCSLYLVWNILSSLHTNHIYLELIKQLIILESKFFILFNG